MDLEMTVRYIILGVGAVVILAILWDGLRRKKLAAQLATPEEEAMPEAEASEDLIDQAEEEVVAELETATESDKPAIEPPAPSFKLNDFITLYLRPTHGRRFGGYELLQTILGAGFQYGEMQIFHYFQEKDRSIPKLFSLASAEEPGDFNLSEMGSFSCNGLILYMKISDHDQPLPIFDLMLDTAFQLAEDLDAEISLGDNLPWCDRLTREVRDQLKAREQIPAETD